MKVKKENYRFLPYEADFNILNNWRLCGTILLYIISLLSILIPLLRNLFLNLQILKIVFEFANYIFIIAYFIINIVTETFIYPAVSRLRRINFIDNSFGSKFFGEESLNYFTNDTLEPGAYKMIVNCFENCFFTYHISRGMLKYVIIKNSIFSIVFLSFAYVGLKDNSIALPILQIFLSSLFITELIHHINFLSKLKVLLDKFKLFFIGIIDSNTNNKILDHSILLMLDYETNLAFNKSPLSDRIYMKLKDKLSVEWEKIKSYYKIVK